jgi:hypothetical protein
MKTFKQYLMEHKYTDQELDQMVKGNSSQRRLVAQYGTDKHRDKLIRDNGRTIQSGQRIACCC